LSARIDEGLHYTFTCPNCSGNFSILLEKIPPVQARFRCPHCQKPMDFPSREEARVYAQLQAKSGKPPATPRPSREPAAPDEPGGSAATRFQIQKSGFEKDVFDRRGMRNLIRTAAIEEKDLVRVDDGQPVAAGSLPYLQSLFALRRKARGAPPPCCRTHTEKVAFFQCQDTGRPLCEECAAEKKFGGTVIRVCQHCGGTARELPPA
jgi:predicted Zn finger-like uncharacterized protein